MFAITKNMNGTANAIYKDNYHITEDDFWMEKYGKVSNKVKKLKKIQRKW